MNLDEKYYLIYSSDIDEALEAVLKRFNDFDYYCMGVGTIRIEKAED